MRIGSLFSGYGGLEMGVQAVLGGSAVWHSEIDPGACKILAHRYPDVPNLGDITAVDWSAVEPVDVMTGGSPCQDVSSAGKRLGMRSGTRSGLWAAMCDAIDIIRPSLVVWENVRGVLSAGADSSVEPCSLCVGDERDSHLRALGRVVGDLSELGYVGRWVGLRASDVGAPHGRFRVFVAAWPAADPANDGRQWARQARVRRSGSADNSDGLVAHLAGNPRRVIDRDGVPAVEWGPFSEAIRGWERVTRPAPSPFMDNRKGAPQLAPIFAEWMMGLPAGWVTDVPGLTRNEQLKALGNGVVPQQAAEALRLLLPDVAAVAV